jgi:hypothetical protein
MKRQRQGRGRGRGRGRDGDRDEAEAEAEAEADLRCSCVPHRRQAARLGQAALLPGRRGGRLGTRLLALLEKTKNKLHNSRISAAVNGRSARHGRWEQAGYHQATAIGDGHG